MPTWQQNIPTFPQKIQSDCYSRSLNPYTREFHEFQAYDTQYYSSPSLSLSETFPFEYNQYNHYDLQVVSETPPSWGEIHHEIPKVEWTPMSWGSSNNRFQQVVKVEETPPSWEHSSSIKIKMEQEDISLPKSLPSLYLGETNDSNETTEPLSSMPTQEPVEVSVKNNKRRRSEIESVDFMSYGLPEDFKLPVSKSPIMESLSFCAVEKWGIEVVTAEATSDGNASVIFKVTNFDMYYKYSCAICSKHKPTEDVGARVKALRRWFSDFPKKKFRKNNPVFQLEVKPQSAKKVYDMIQRHRSLTTMKKRRLN